MFKLSFKHYASLGFGVAVGAVMTHKVYGDYPLFGVELELPADLEGDPKDGKPMFRLRPRSEIIEHAARHKKEEDQVSLDKIQKDIKQWADKYDENNKRAPDEVWAKIEKYGWAATISHRAGFKDLEDVIKYDDVEVAKSDDQQIEGNEHVALSVVGENARNSELIAVEETVQSPVLIAGESESFQTSATAEDISEHSSEIIVDHLTTPNILVDESLRDPEIISKANVT